MLEFSWIQGVLVVAAIAGTLVLSVPRPQQPVLVTYMHPATRQQETTTMTTTRTNHDDAAPLDEPGDLFSVPEDPVLEPTPETRLVDVIINTRIARSPEGDKCIRVYLPVDGVLTAAEASELIQNLMPAIEASAGIRNALGYNS